MSRIFEASLTILVGTAMALTACGGGLGKKKSSSPTAAAPTAAESKAEAAGLLSGQAAAAGSAAPVANPVTDAGQALTRAVSTQIATCAGYGDEEAAVQAKTDELLAQNATPEDSAAALAPLLAALEAKSAAASDATISCLDASRTSAPAQSLAALIAACYTQPAAASAPSKDDKHGGKSGLGKVFKILVPPIPGLGKDRPHDHGRSPAPDAGPPDLRLPPPEEAAFDTDACKAALTASQEEVAALAAAAAAAAAPASTP